MKHRTMDITIKLTVEGQGESAAAAGLDLRSNMWLRLGYLTALVDPQAIADGKPHAFHPVRPGDLAHLQHELATVTVKEMEP
jgi:hypothetical protein